MSGETFSKLDPAKIVDDDVACRECSHSVPDWHCVVTVYAVGSEPNRRERHCDLCDCRVEIGDTPGLVIDGDVQGPTI